MGLICRCGNREFEHAMEPVSKPLGAGVTPPVGKFYYRCNNQSCKLPMSEALELKHKCLACGGESFRAIGPTEIGTVIDERVYLDIKVMVVECIGCHKMHGEDHLEEQAVIRAYDEGFVVQRT